MAYDDDDEELRALAEQIGRMILDGLGTRSKWAAVTAVETRRREGCFGILTIQIPPKCKDNVEIGFTVNAAEVTTRWDLAGPRGSHD